MKRNQTTQLNLELNMAKIQGIKPNFTQLAKKYSVDRHTVARYYREGGKAIITRDRPSYLNPYLDEIEEMMSTIHPTKKLPLSTSRINMVRMYSEVTVLLHICLKKSRLMGV